MAAIDAAFSRRWIAEPIEDEQGSPRLATQRRWLERGGDILGLSAAPSLAMPVAAHLGVPGIEHEIARSEFASARLVTKGRAVVSVLELIGLDDSLWPRMSAAIDLVGRWGRVWLVEPAIGRRISPGLALAREPPTK